MYVFPLSLLHNFALIPTCSGLSNILCERPSRRVPPSFLALQSYFYIWKAAVGDASQDHLMLVSDIRRACLAQCHFLPSSSSRSISIHLVFVHSYAELNYHRGKDAITLVAWSGTGDCLHGACRYGSTHDDWSCLMGTCAATQPTRTSWNKCLLVDWHHFFSNTFTLGSGLASI